MRHERPGSAGMLTLSGAVRRISVTARRAGCIGRMLLCTGVLAMAPLPVAAADHHPVNEITQAAEDYLERRLASTDRQLAPRAGSLDPRLRLARCDRPLEGFLRAGAETGRRTIVGVRCGGGNPWKVYVPVDLVEMRAVLVARQALPRGHALAADDLVPERRDVSRLSGGFVTRPDSVVGRRLKRQLVSGTALSPAMLETQVMVRRGQSVTLVVRNDALNIRMAGTALMDGAVDQRIRVENTGSRRVVEGFVRSPEYVEVLVQ